MKWALVLIDIQNDYFPGGMHELFQPERAAGQAAKILERFRAEGLPVFHIQHISIREGAGFFLPGTGGAGIHPLVAPGEGEPVVVKHAPNAFLNTGLAERLREQGVEGLVVSGMMSHMCVDTSVRAAKDLGFSIALAEDACATRDLLWNETRIPAATVHHAFMAALNGTFARVVRAEDILAMDFSL
jgi:nicotinamidase-related amidase